MLLPANTLVLCWVPGLWLPARAPACPVAAVPATGNLGMAQLQAGEKGPKQSLPGKAPALTAELNHLSRISWAVTLPRAAVTSQAVCHWDQCKEQPGPPAYDTVTLIAQFTLRLLSQKNVLQLQRFGRVPG